MVLNESVISSDPTVLREVAACRSLNLTGADGSRDQVVLELRDAQALVHRLHFLFLDRIWVNMGQYLQVKHQFISNPVRWELVSCACFDPRPYTASFSSHNRQRADVSCLSLLPVTS